MPGPMHGVRIVDPTQMISGPLGSMMLADQGASEGMTAEVSVALPPKAAHFVPQTAPELRPRGGVGRLDRAAHYEIGSSASPTSIPTKAGIFWEFS